MRKVHQIVVNALKKDNWNVNYEPLYIQYDDDRPAYEIDLGAEQLIIAEKENRRIAVEIKTFAGSISHQFHSALGQFLDYRKLWIFEDKTDIDVAQILVKAGVAKEDIVLGFLSPTLREFSEYAVC